MNLLKVLGFSAVILLPQKRHLYISLIISFIFISFHFAGLFLLMTVSMQHFMHGPAGSSVFVIVVNARLSY